MLVPLTVHDAYLSYDQNTVPSVRVTFTPVDPDLLLDAGNARSFVPSPLTASGETGEVTMSLTASTTDQIAYDVLVNLGAQKQNFRITIPVDPDTTVVWELSNRGAQPDGLLVGASGGGGGGFGGGGTEGF